MRKLMLILIALIAVINFIRAYDAPVDFNISVNESVCSEAAPMVVE